MWLLVHSALIETLWCIDLEHLPHCAHIWGWVMFAYLKQGLNLFRKESEDTQEHHGDRSVYSYRIHCASVRPREEVRDETV